MTANGDGYDEDHTHDGHTHDEHAQDEHTQQLPAGVAQAHPEEGGGSYLYFDERLIVAKRDVERTLAELDVRCLPANVLEPDGAGHAGDDSNYAVVQFQKRDLSVPQLVTALRALDGGHGGEHLDVSPDHVMVGFTHPIPIRGTTCPVPAEQPLGPAPAPHDDFPNLPGHGVRVAVLDTGYLEKHPWLRQVTGVDQDDLEAPPPSGQVLPWYCGHGTFVAGMIVQHAPGVKIHARNILSRRGPVGDASLGGLHDFGMVSDVGLAQMLRSLPANIDILNLSIGGPTHGNLGLRHTGEALAWLSRRNPDLVVVAAAGNDAETTPNFPAAYKSVIGVAALDGDAGACWTNHGQWVDACAQGVNACSAFLTYQGDIELIDDRHGCPHAEPPQIHDLDFGGFAYWSGTSFATPRVVGAIAAAMTTFGIGAQEAAFRVCGPGQPRLVDDHNRDLGVVVYPGTWAYA